MLALREIEPTIWRRLRVPADVPLGRLHDILQAAFGWTDSHLHDFMVEDVRFGMMDTEDEFFAIDEHQAPVGAVARQDTKFLYRYDFGDDWEHEVTIEASSNLVPKPSSASAARVRVHQRIAAASADTSTSSRSYPSRDTPNTRR